MQVRSLIIFAEIYRLVYADPKIKFLLLIGEELSPVCFHALFNAPSAINREKRASNQYLQVFLS